MVTGAAGSGMGRSIALTLAREGADVVVNFLTGAERSEAIVDHIRSRGGRAIAVRADAFEAEGCRQLVEAAEASFGGVDICVVGPGGGWHTEPIEAIDPGTALEDVRREVAPLYHLMSLVLPGMYERRWGRVLALAVHPTDLPPAYAYNVAKAARTQALLHAADQAWSHDVTVNVIAPGPVSPYRTLKQAVESCDRGASWRDRKNTSPQDIAEGVAWLCSDEARFVSGCILPYVFY